MIVFANNFGNRAAVMGEAKYSVNGGESRRFVSPLSSDSRLIEGGAARSIDFVVDDNLYPEGLIGFPDRQQPDCTVSVTIKIATFDQRTDSKTVACACPGRVSES